MEQALEDVANMACTVPLKREAEEQKKGLVIVNATYGLLQDATAPLTTLNSPDDEFSIDVTIPVQCMVEDSTLILPAGESKSWLTGFYDPCIGDPKQLRVRYLFWGRLHEVVINDEDPLKIPMKGHLLGDEVQFRAQVRPNNILLHFVRGQPALEKLTLCDVCTLWDVCSSFPLAIDDAVWVDDVPATLPPEEEVCIFSDTW